MMKETMEFKDWDLGTVKRDSRLSSNQIKTRQSSYRSISSNWTKFRISLLSKKLDRIKNELVTDTYQTTDSGNLTSSAVSSIASRSEAIARLEEKIKILAKETVPSKFVSSRAIKLRNKMMQNLVSNGESAYVSETNYDKVLSDDVPSVEVPLPEDEVVAAQVSPEIDVEKVVAENKQVIADEVNQAMSSDEDTIEPITIVSEVSPIINRDEIGSVLEDEMAKVDDSSSRLVSSEEVADAVNAAFENVGVDKVEETEKVKEEIPVISRDEIEKEIDASLSSVNNQTEEVVDSNVPNEENDIIIPVQSPVDESPIDYSDSTSENVEESVVVPVEPSVEVSDVVSEKSPVEIPEDVPEEPVEVQEDVVDSPKEEVEVSVPVEDPVVVIPEENVEEHVHVSQNNSTEAKVNSFDENGLRKQRYDYKPMTDEEIEAARRNIEYDAYETLYRKEWEAKKRGLVESLENAKSAFQPVYDSKKNEVAVSENVRELPIVVPERNVVDLYTKEKEPETDKLEEYTFNESTSESEEKTDEGLHFDYSQATGRDVAFAAGVETSLKGLEALKKRALKLKEENLQSQIANDDARKAQAEEAEKALEIKHRTEEKKRAYAAKLKKLEDYCEALEEDTRINLNAAETAKTDMACNRRFIEDKEAEMSDYDDRMSEIDSIIAPEAINVRVR